RLREWLPFRWVPQFIRERHTANDRSRLANRSGEARRLARNVLVAIQMPCNFFNAGLTQKIGIALAGLGKLDDSPGDDSVGELVKARGSRTPFERAPTEPSSFRERHRSRLGKSYWTCK